MGTLHAVKSQEQNLYFKGLPTDIEVNKLREQYPEGKMSVGDFYPYVVVEKLLSIDRGLNRFKTVTMRWRKIVERETNIVIDTVAGEGFKVLSEVEKIGTASKYNRRAATSAKKGFMRASRVDRKQLGPEELVTLTHQLNVAAKIHASAQLKGPALLPEV